MSNDILTSVDLMTAATELDDANEAYRAAMVRQALAQRELASADGQVEETERAFNVARRALLEQAVVNPVTSDFWANPLA